MFLLQGKTDKKLYFLLRRRPDSNEKFDIKIFITYNLLSNFLKILNHQSVVVVHLQVILLAKIRWKWITKPQFSSILLSNYCVVKKEKFKENCMI